MLKEWRCYRKTDRSTLIFTVHLGNKLTGHPKTLHGGITALLFDNALGWTVYLLPKEPAGHQFYTAHLGVDYRSPAILDAEEAGDCDVFEIECRVEKIEGRKV